MNEDILKTIKEKGLLLERDIFELISNFQDSKVAQDFLENIANFSGQKIITKSVLNKNFEYLRGFVNKLPGENKNTVENIVIKLGIQLEIRKEVESEKLKQEEKKQDFQVFYSTTKVDKKLEAVDFANNFRARYQQLQRILMYHPGLVNLISINKISGDRQSISIIGIVTDKRITKNKNLIIKFEDLTGEISALVRVDREEIFEKANELQLDDIVGIKATGSKEMLFINDVLFPDSFVSEKVKFEEENCLAFLSDVHCGSNRHTEKSFLKFLEWINSEDETARRIKYIFFVGDNVDGVGIYPGQENFLNLKSMEEQYSQLALYLKRIPNHITIFMCPGQHDAVRVAEPQPIIGRKYAALLYEIPNLVLVTNPTLVKLFEKNKEFKILMYHGASLHSLINEIKELREMKAHRTPAKAARHILKRRHLAPTHSSVVYIPNAEKDPLVISEVPDIFCTGEMHRLDIETYNGILIIVGSCWQTQTPFEEKTGNIPDPCKVPVFNLKTRELKIFDFSDETEMKK